MKGAILMAIKILHFPPWLHKYTEMHFPGFPTPLPQIAGWKESDSLSYNLAIVQR